MCEPWTNRVINAPRSGRYANTSGATPAAAAADAASFSAARSIPSRSVSLPDSRTTNDSPAMSTLKFRFVMPIVIGVTIGSEPLQSGIDARTAASAGSMAASTRGRYCRPSRSVKRAWAERRSVTQRVDTA